MDKHSTLLLRGIAVIGCLLFFPKAFSQQFEQFPAPDSLIKALHVKKIVQKFDKKSTGSDYVEWNYDNNGHLAETIEYPKKIDLYLPEKTKYHYDAMGRLVLVERQAHNLAAGTKGDTAFTMNSVFKYENALRIGTHTNAAIGLTVFDSLIWETPFTRVLKLYSADNKLRNEGTETFEKENVFKKRIFLSFDSSEKIIQATQIDFINFFNQAGQLIESLQLSPFCTSTFHFKYYKNGLLKSISPSECFASSKFTYSFY